MKPFSLVKLHELHTEIRTTWVGTYMMYKLALIGRDIIELLFAEQFSNWLSLIRDWASYASFVTIPPSLTVSVSQISFTVDVDVAIREGSLFL
jgi:hypothetical protein